MYLFILVGLHRLRQIKSDAEIEVMRKGSRHYKTGT